MLRVEKYREGIRKNGVGGSEWNMSLGGRGTTVGGDVCGRVGRGKKKGHRWTVDVRQEPPRGGGGGE